MKAKEILVTPGVYDGLTVRLVQAMEGNSLKRHAKKEQNYNQEVWIMRKGMNKMNSSIVTRGILILMLVCASLALIPWPGDSVSAAERKEYFVGSMTSSGSGYLWVSAVSEVVNRYVPQVRLTPQGTPSTEDNILRMKDGRLSLGLALQMVAHEYYTGKAGVKYDGLRSLWALYATRTHFLTPKDSGINSLMDLKGKRVSFSPMGSGSYNVTKCIMDALGLDMKKDFKAQFIESGESASALKNRAIMAWIVHPSLPHPVTMDLAVTLVGGVKLVSLSEDEIKKTITKYPALSRTVIPGGTYTGVSQDVAGVGAYTYLYATPSFPEDLAYSIAKVLHEHHDEVIKNYASAKESTAETTAQFPAIPLHPGVKKYLTEKGFLK